MRMRLLGFGQKVLTKSINLFISYFKLSQLRRKDIKHIYFYEAMRQRDMIYWNSYDASFQWKYMNEPWKSLYFRSGFFSNILFAAATLLFLEKQKRGASFAVTWSYYYIYSSSFFSSQPLIIFIQNFNKQNTRHVN